MTATVHQMKITLNDIRPPIWRRIEVPSDITLGELSGVLEAAMGWYGGHLHGFDANGTRYGMPDPEWGSSDLDELKEWLPLDFDPEHFDIAETDADMRTPRPSFDW